MAPIDLEGLVAFIVLLIASDFWGIGDAFSSMAVDPAWMNKLTLGIFGENGGLIYWLNEKLLWMLENILAGLNFTIS
jgi:hypothetical protein